MKPRTRLIKPSPVTRLPMALLQPLSTTRSTGSFML
jgi:hypothetical protein